MGCLLCVDDFEDAPGQEALLQPDSVEAPMRKSLDTSFMDRQLTLAHPAPTAGVSRPASPSRTAPTQALSQPLGLSAALESARLAKYESALRDLGCEHVVDLADLEEQDFMELGMKKIEVTRLRRLVT